jgi:hypothetical protein
MAWEEFGKILKSKKGKLYIKLDDNIKTVKIKGKNYKDNDYDLELKGGDAIMIEKCIDEINRLEEMDQISEEEANKRRARFEKGGSLDFIKYTLKVPPKNDN